MCHIVFFTVIDEKFKQLMYTVDLKTAVNQILLNSQKKNDSYCISYCWSVNFTDV
jgi:hypothetical protein